MKKSRLLASLVASASIFLLCVGLVQADPWSALNSGYAVTIVSPPHGEDVQVNTPVTARAGTTDGTVDKVKFRWMYDDTEKFSETVMVEDSGETWKGKPIYDAYSTYTPNIVGDWAVQVFFYAPEGHLRGEAIVRIRATSFFVIPEVAIGTLTILLTMLTSLAIFARKRKLAF